MTLTKNKAPAKKKPRTSRIAILDSETDPFEQGVIVAPFAWGLLIPDAGIYVDFWGPDATRALIEFLADWPDDLVIYAHNGGKFDFHFLWKEGWIGNPIRIVHGRLLTATLLGRHELRDSWGILPLALDRYKKTEIDYAKMHHTRREAHRAEILQYLRDDCTNLAELVLRFVERFGLKLTMGGNAMSQLRKLHPQRNNTPERDAMLRPYYLGGRCQGFEKGILRGRWRVYDRNSMYPAVMVECDHPGPSQRWIRPHLKELDRDGWVKRFKGRFYFATVIADNIGALPVKVRSAAGEKITMQLPYGEFRTNSHELRLAMSLGLVRVREIRELLVPGDVQRFTEFVDIFSAEKVSAKKAGNKVDEILAKLTLNSAYGKFGQNPGEFKDWALVWDGDQAPDWREGWKPYSSGPDWRLFCRPSTATRRTQDGLGVYERPAGAFFDVGVAASITAASRASLMRVLVAARRPVYCDTDSVICEGFNGNGPELHDSRLGAWKLEGEGDTMCVAGRKLYALFDGPECVKHACKGVQLEPHEIARIAAGESITWTSERPSFNVRGNPYFVSRSVRRT